MGVLCRRSRGFTLIELLIVITVIGILVAGAAPFLLDNRKAADEVTAVGSLRTIRDVEVPYFSLHNTYGMLPQLAADHLIDPAIGSATSSASVRAGYYYTFISCTPSQFAIVGQPIPMAGEKIYYLDESGVLFSATIGTALPTADAGGIAPSPAWTQLDSSYDSSGGH